MQGPKSEGRQCAWRPRCNLVPPTGLIVAKTVKGKGVSFMEGQSAWHGKPIGKDDYSNAMQELEMNV